MRLLHFLRAHWLLLVVVVQLITAAALVGYIAAGALMPTAQGEPERTRI